MSNVFISYKTSKVNNPTAQLLYEFLKPLGHNVFLDKRDLIPGQQWDETIFNKISDSDVLIVLITSDIIVGENNGDPVVASWVQREVDYARGCRVQILPVVLQNADLQRDPITKNDIVSVVMRLLALAGMQYVTALDTENNPDRRFAEVLRWIESSSPRTRDEQKAFSEELGIKWEKQDKEDLMKNPPPQSYPRYISFALIKPDLMRHPCTIHLAVGDITKMSNAKQPIDILVNSENVYMQMQRVVDKDSVSKKIRLSGANGRGNYIKEDTIQSELFSQVYSPDGRGVPVEIGDVFVTGAGYQDSDLRRQGIQYVFHVAAVDADTKSGQKALSEDGQVITCVRNCFAKFDELNTSSKHGQSPLKSMILPLIGTGNGGLQIERAAQAILDCAIEYLLENPSISLEHFYITAYTMGDARKVSQIMGAKLHPLNNN